MIDRMGLDKHSVMIIHGGGIFENDGGKPATLNRIKQNFLKLPLNVQQRIVLENDDVCYSAEDLLPLCEELDIPCRLAVRFTVKTRELTLLQQWCLITT